MNELLLLTTIRRNESSQIYSKLLSSTNNELIIDEKYNESIDKDAIEENTGQLISSIILKYYGDEDDDEDDDDDDDDDNEEIEENVYKTNNEFNDVNFKNRIRRKRSYEGKDSIDNNYYYEKKYNFNVQIDSKDEFNQTSKLNYRKHLFAKR